MFLIVYRYGMMCSVAQFTNVKAGLGAINYIIFYFKQLKSFKFVYKLITLMLKT